MEMMGRTDPVPIGSFYDPFDRTLVIDERELADLMCEACRHGEIRPIRQLLDAGADVNALDSNGYFPLYWAAANGHLKALLLLLKSGANVNQLSRREGLTALHGAAWHGHALLVQTLIEAGAEVNARSQAGTTPVLHAAGGGHLDVTRILIFSGGDINLQDCRGTTVLIYACAVGNLDLIKLAVESHADTALRTKRGLNALDVACREGQLESVRILLAQNADVNRPLHLASGFGHTEVCRLLLEYGFDIESLSYDGLTVLEAACYGKCPETVKYLLENGANPSGKDGVTAPILEASVVGSLDCVKILVEAGADVNWRCAAGNYALRAARVGGHGAVVEFLMYQGAIDYDEHQKSLDSEIIAAAGSGNVAHVQDLLDQGANVHGIDGQGRTALIVAASQVHVTIVEALLGAGSEVDATMRATGQTALLMAAKNGHREAVKMLAKAGADLNRRTHDTRQTPMVFAAARGDVNLVQFLIEAGAILDGEALFASISSGDVGLVEYLASVGTDLNMESKTRRTTPLLYALETSNANMVEALLLSGASPNKQFGSGLTPLAMAAGLGGKKMVSLLLSAGADGQFDRQAFIRAAAAGHPGIVRRLLSDGASPEPKALIRAAGEGHAEVVRILLEAGADPNKRTKQGHTALDFAKAGGHTQVVEILMEQATNSAEYWRRNSNTANARKLVTPSRHVR